LITKQNLTKKCTASNSLRLSSKRNY